MKSDIYVNSGIDISWNQSDICALTYLDQIKLIKIAFFVIHCRIVYDNYTKDLKRLMHH